MKFKPSWPKQSTYWNCQILKNNIVTLTQYKLISIYISYMPQIYYRHLQPTSVVHFIQLCNNFKGSFWQYGILHMYHRSIVGQQYHGWVHIPSLTHHTLPFKVWNVWHFAYWWRLTSLDWMVGSFSVHLAILGSWIISFSIRGILFSSFTILGTLNSSFTNRLT